MDFRDVTIDDGSCWVEIDRAALAGNIRRFRTLVGDRRLMAVVKANAYGHGMPETAGIVLEAGADWLGVFSSAEGLALRAAGIEVPVLVLGPVHPGSTAQAVGAGLRLTVASEAAADTLCRVSGGPRTAHLKIETGTNRQGLFGEALVATARRLRDAGVTVEGAYTHFADIEDTTDHAFAEHQLRRFNESLGQLRDAGIDIPVPHTACSAAAILFPDTYFEMVRVGIGMYGLWPSGETRVSARSLGRNALDLAPVMTWKTRIAQVKTVAAGEFVGYGRTVRTTRETRLAVLPVGYSDGYDRRLSGVGHVLVRGARAPVLGRICMNLMMVDGTDVPGIDTGDEVVLLGRQGDEVITAEHLARLAGTINYEIVTRAAPGAPRRVV